MKLSLSLAETFDKQIKKMKIMNKINFLFNKLTKSYYKNIFIRKLKMKVFKTVRQN